jgi:hypothetical protein
LRRSGTRTLFSSWEPSHRTYLWWSFPNTIQM